jgi:hypothetical protein
MGIACLSRFTTPAIEAGREPTHARSDLDPWPIAANLVANLVPHRVISRHLGHPKRFEMVLHAWANPFPASC